MWSTSAAAPGKAIGTAVASSQLPEIMANGRNHSTGIGREAKLPEVWKAKGKPPGGLHFRLGGKSLPKEERYK